MSAAEQLNDGVTGDKVPEAQMAEILGTTIAALRSKRARNQIPLGHDNLEPPLQSLSPLHV